MLWIHPFLATCGLALALYALLLGWRRLASAHLGRKGLVFPWRRHVAVGGLALGLWLAAPVGGLGAAWWTWKTVFITGLHYQVGLAMAPLAVLGLASGLYMDRRKARRKALPLLHGLVNLLLVLLGLVQLTTGALLIRQLVLP